MTERKITVTANPTTAQSVSVSPNSVQTYINATPDTSLYYSTISRKWAVEMGGLVNGEDYSAKHYAGQSAQSATEAQNFAEQAEALEANIDAVVSNATTEINAIKDSILQDESIIAIKDNLDNITTTAVNIEDINTNAENIEAIKNASTIALDKADRDLSNLSEEGQAKFDEKANKTDVLNKQQITNCLLEVPQRIKLELNNGTLTLKAGSEVIVPNGFEADGTTPKFDYVKIESEVDYTYKHAPSSNTQVMLFINKQGTGFVSPRNLGSCYSGAIQPTGNYINWYNTTENLMYSFSTNPTVETSEFSLPIAIITQGSDGVTKSIDQVFNGRGYIGSTIWVDKGVKVLIPNGRNEDGTLKNIENTTSAILLTNARLDNTGVVKLAYWGKTSFSEGYLSNFMNGWNFYVQDEQPITTATYIRWYSPKDNKWRASQDKGATWTEEPTVILCDYYGDTTKVTSMIVKQPFRAVDYNDKAEISGWGMPSSKYIDLTLGASTSTYIAPANGYYLLSKYATLQAQNIGMSKFGKLWAFEWAPIAKVNLFCWVPVQKGETIAVNYSADGQTNYFRFYYAEGEV